MKKIVFIALLSVSVTSFAQNTNDDWLLGVGVNAVNNLGKRNPVETPDKWSFNMPFSVSVEKSWSRLFAIEVLLGLNEFSYSQTIDGNTVENDETYFSVDTNLKYYFGKHVFKNTSRFDLFATAGPGFFIIDNSNISLNVGGGALVWLNSKQSFGLKLQAVSKFALDAEKQGIDNNHFQYHAQVVFRL